MVVAYRTPSMKTRDARVLILSQQFWVTVKAPDYIRK
jgi:hypothetical protein